ncbi:MAG: aquaporin [Terriglobia bacterium]
MREHWPEYMSEFLGTAIMMTIGVGAITLMWGDGSPVPAVIPPARLRLLLTGILFAGGATLVVYSRLGQRSGAHINPAVTLAFWRLGKIRARDAVAYAGAQFLGATAGVLVVRLAAGQLAWGVPVRLGLTQPGEGIHPLVAFAAEIGITFLLVGVILVFVNRPRLAPRTGLVAGALVAFLVTVEAPVSGTSLNPARSLGPAVVTASFVHQWIYLLAPPLGALLAVGLFGRRGGAKTQPLCAKLYHTERYRCIFANCAYHRVRAGETLVHEGEDSDRAFVIERGEVEVRKKDEHGREVVLARLGSPQWVGEMGLLLNQPRSASVVAVTDLQLRPITRENFSHVIAEHPETALEVMRQLSQRLFEADRRLVL